MKLAIISPIENAEYLAEFTDFDVALGYMAMRYPRYLEVMQSLRFAKREMVLMQMPEHEIRNDYYITTAKRLQPTTIVTPHKTGAPAQMQFDLYMEYLRSNRHLKEQGYEWEIAPYITTVDDDKNLACYSEITKNWFVQWDAAETLSTKFVHHSTIVGIPDESVLKAKRPTALITAHPVSLARFGEVTTFGLTPDWFHHPLTDEQLAIAVESIKELRNVVTNPKT